MEEPADVSAAALGEPSASCPQTDKNVKMAFICRRQHQVRLSAFQQRRQPTFGQSERQVWLLPTNVAGDECEDSAVFPVF